MGPSVPSTTARFMPPAEGVHGTDTVPELPLGCSPIVSDAEPGPEPAVLLWFSAETPPPNPCRPGDRGRMEGNLPPVDDGLATWGRTDKDHIMIYIFYFFQMYLQLYISKHNLIALNKQICKKHPFPNKYNVILQIEKI